MPRLKRYPVLKSGRELTPELADALAKEAEEDIDPSLLRRRVLTQPAVAKQTLSARIGMHLANFRDAVRWKIEDGVHAVGKLARQARKHGIKPL